MITIKTYAGDKLYDIDFTLQTSAAAAFDITGYSAVKLRAQKQGVATLEVDGACSVISAAAGTVRYNVADGELDTAGDYYAEIEVTFAGGKILTFGDFLIRVLPQLPR